MSTKSVLGWNDASVRWAEDWIHAVVPVPPSGDAVYRVGKRKIFPSQEWVDFQAGFKLLVQAKKVPRIPYFKKGIPLRVSMMWCRKIRSGDLSNRKKTIEDAVQGHFMENDSEVVEQHAFRFDEYPGLARVEIVVSDARTESEIAHLLGDHPDWRLEEGFTPPFRGLRLWS